MRKFKNRESSEKSTKDDEIRQHAINSRGKDPVENTRKS